MRRLVNPTRKFTWLSSDDTISAGYKVGRKEVDQWKTSGDDLVENTLSSLEYFSDRWSPSRVGRMDAFIEALTDRS